MNSKTRREYIEKMLLSSDATIKGSALAEELRVTRQIIVKDIAILRAEGKKILATPEGYMILGNEKNMVKKVIALCHKASDIKDELETIIRFGGIVEDVIVEHPLYGELKGMIMIKSLYDIENFMKKIQENKAEPLLILTGGVHIHTIAVDSQEVLDKIIAELKIKKYLISD